jgi:methylenetetrahydrofolate dehydrogenase (NADP+) / methenyltetrahydrofolate cyclohydrolase
VTAELLHGEPVAVEIREEVTDRVRELSERDVVPTLGTVLMSDDPADVRFMDLKHSACDDAGVATRDVRLDPSAPAERLHGTLEDLCTDPEVHAVFVQVPLPEQVSMTAVRRRIDPEKDVDCFHPENVGRLVAGDPRFVPATPAAVRRLLAAYDVPVEGEDVVIVGRSDVIGKPLANLLLQNAPCGNATVTVCHSRTSDLGEKTRRADLVVTTCGVPGLVDGSMLSSGVVVVDVSANRRPTDDGTDEFVGDVEYESARNVADAITPVPGGVGPVTLSMLLRNVVLSAERRYWTGSNANLEARR